MIIKPLPKPSHKWTSLNNFRVFCQPVFCFIDFDISILISPKPKVGSPEFFQLIYLNATITFPMTISNFIFVELLSQLQYTYWSHHTLASVMRSLPCLEASSLLVILSVSGYIIR